MDGQDLLKLSLGERLVTVARLLAAEHVRQELDAMRSAAAAAARSPKSHVATLTQLAAPVASEVEPVQQHRYTPARRPPVSATREAA